MPSAYAAVNSTVDSFMRRRKVQRPRDSRERTVPVGTQTIAATLSVPHPFEADEEDNLPLLLRQQRQGTVEIPEMQPRSLRGGTRRCRRHYIMVDLFRQAFADAPADAIHVKVVQDRKQPGADVRPGLPE